MDVSPHGDDRCTNLNTLITEVGMNGRVVLTTAHLCQDSKCDDEYHMKAMCQGCHLRYDRGQHSETMAKKKDAKTGQGRLRL